MTPEKTDSTLTMNTGPNTLLNSDNMAGKNFKFWSYVLWTITFIHSICVQPFCGKGLHPSLWAGSWVYLTTLILCNFYSTYIIYKCGRKPWVGHPWPTGILWFMQQVHFKEVQVMWNSVNQWLCCTCGLKAFINFHWKSWISGNCWVFMSSGMWHCVSGWELPFIQMNAGHLQWLRSPQRMPKCETTRADVKVC